MKINLGQFRRFEKQIILKNIGLAGQKKIFAANVLIIGLGGLGCPLLTYLVSSGVGKIGIVDFDKVEISNLNRQTLFTTSDIGKYKVDQAKSSINRINNKIKIKIFKKRITSKNIKSVIKDFYDKNPQRLTNQIRYKFRDGRKYMPYSLCWHLLIKENLYVESSTNKLVEINKSRNLSAKKLEKILKSIDSKAEVKFLNIQDLNMAEPETQQVFQNWFIRKINS